MRIAFGLDSVFADLESALRTLSSTVFKTELSGLSAYQRRLLQRVVRASENFWEHLDEIEPGAVARLAAIASERHWEVIFLVRRTGTIGATPQLQSQKWLAAKGFAWPSVYVVDGPLGKIASALGVDAVVDSPFPHPLDASHRSSAEPVDACLRRLCEMDDRGTPWRKRLSRKVGGRAPKPGAIQVSRQVLGLGLAGPH